MEKWAKDTKIEMQMGKKIYEEIFNFINHLRI
jgi:hypothetical protein